MTDLALGGHFAAVMPDLGGGMASNFPADPSSETRLHSATRAAPSAMKHGWASGVAVEEDEQRRRVFRAIPMLCP